MATIRTMKVINQINSIRNKLLTGDEWVLLEELIDEGYTTNNLSRLNDYLLSFTLKATLIVTEGNPYIKVTTITTDMTTVILKRILANNLRGFEYDRHNVPRLRLLIERASQEGVNVLTLPFGFFVNIKTGKVTFCEPNATVLEEVTSMFVITDDNRLHLTGVADMVIRNSKLRSLGQLTEAHEVELSNYLEVNGFLPKVTHPEVWSGTQDTTIPEILTVFTNLTKGLTLNPKERKEFLSVVRNHLRNPTAETEALITATTNIAASVTETTVNIKAVGFEEPMGILPGSSKITGQCLGRVKILPLRN